MKKRFYTGLLAAMLLLSGCSKPVEETPVPNTTWSAGLLHSAAK